MLLTPGAVPAADWRAIYQGATPTLDPACRPAIAGSVAAIDSVTRRIITNQEAPVQCAIITMISAPSASASQQANAAR